MVVILIGDLTSLEASSKRVKRQSGRAFLNLARKMATKILDSSRKVIVHWCFGWRNCGGEWIIQKNWRVAWTSVFGAFKSFLSKERLRLRWKAVLGTMRSTHAIKWLVLLRSDKRLYWKAGIVIINGQRYWHNNYILFCDVWKKRGLWSVLGLRWFVYAGCRCSDGSGRHNQKQWLKNNVEIPRFNGIFNMIANVTAPMPKSYLLFQIFDYFLLKNTWSWIKISRKKTQ